MSSIDAINGLSYSNPMELLYNPSFLTAYQTPNPNNPAFKGMQQTSAPYEYQLPQYSDLLPQPSNISFNGAEPAEKSGGSNILGWGALAALVATTGYAAYKGKGNLKEGFKAIWNGIKGKFGSEAKNTAKKAAKEINFKNAEEYTISKGGTSIVIKDGKPIKIITKSKKAITESKEVQEWVKNNTTVLDEIKGKYVNKTITLADGATVEIKGGKPIKIITPKNSEEPSKTITKQKQIQKWIATNKENKKEIDDHIAREATQAFKQHTGTLPKGVSLSYTETIADGDKVYKLTVENGKVAEVYGKNKTEADDKFIRVADDQMAKFLKNHEGIVKKAETLEHTVKLKGKNVKLSVRNGRVVRAKVDGRELTADELGRLQNEHHDIISQFGRNIEYGLKGKDVEYIYRQKGGQKVRFTKNSSSGVDVKSVDSVTEETINDADKITKFLEKNKEINNGVEALKNRTLSEGFRLGTVKVKSKSGNVYSMTGETVTEVKLADGTVKKGEDLKEWLKLAENKNEYDKILESLK